MCLCLLVGFYVLAGGVVVGVVALNVALIRDGVFAPGLLIGSGLAALTVLAAVLVVSLTPAPLAEGIAIDRIRGPELWALVDDIARRARTVPPSVVLVVDEANAFVQEDIRFLGLVSRGRTLCLGWPLIAEMSVDELGAVVGHEVGHFARGDTRLIGVVNRAHDGLAATISFLREAPSKLTRAVAFVFVGYLHVFFLASRSISREQERRADEIAVSIGGTDALRTALGSLTHIGDTATQCRTRIAAPCWRASRSPRRMRETFDRCYAETPRSTSPSDTTRRRRYATHPSIPERLAALNELPRVPATGRNEPGSTLIVDFDELVDDVIRKTGDGIARDTLTPIEIDRVAIEILGPSEEAAAEKIVRKANSVRLCKPSLESALSIFVDGRSRELIPWFYPELRFAPDERKRRALRDLAQPLLLATLVHSGLAQWALTPTSALTVRRAPNGDLIDTDRLVDHLLDAPADINDQLTSLGLHLSTTA